MAGGVQSQRASEPPWVWVRRDSFQYTFAQEINPRTTREQPIPPPGLGSPSCALIGFRFSMASAVRINSSSLARVLPYSSALE